MRRAVLISVLVLIGLVGAAPAQAHRSPADCDANQLDVDLIRDKNLVKNGDVINYTVEVDNIGTRACDVSNITILLQLPGPDGTPSGPIRTVTAAANYAAQAPLTSFGPFPYTVNANPGVGRLEARVSVADGVLHDNDVHSAVNINKTIGSINPVPGIEVDKAARIKNGQAPQTVTYDFKVYNRTVPPTTLDNVTLTDDKCPGVVGPVAGDLNTDKRLQPTEVWEYTCTMVHGAGVFTNTATACAELILSSGEKLPKVCDTDDETVEFTPPPAAPPAAPPPAPPVVPQAGVKPASATQAPCDIKSPTGLRVRARELTTIRVKVRNVDAGTIARITLPGGKVLKAKVNSAGTAKFRVRPPKSGRATIKVADCGDVARFSVKAARKTQTRRAPRVTG